MTIMDNNISNKFEAYYLNRLNKEEAKAFEHQLSSDPELNKEYGHFRLAVEGIKAYEQELQERALEEDEDYLIFQYLQRELPKEQQQQVAHKIETDLDFADKVKESMDILGIQPSVPKSEKATPLQQGPSKPKRQAKRWRRVGFISAIAASIALLFTAAVYLLPQRLTPTLYTAEDIKKWTFSEAKGFAPNSSEAENAIEAKDFQRAENLLRQGDSANYTTKLMLAQVLYCQTPNAPQKVREARRLLLQLIEDSHGDEDEVRLSLALSYLAAPPELEKAKQELMILAKKHKTAPTPFTDKATEEILPNLEK